MLRVVSIFICVLAVAALADFPESSSITAVEKLEFSKSKLDSSGIAGVVAVYDPVANKIMTGHAGRLDRRLIPASTFKIANALIALETNVIANAKSVISWDGIVRGRSVLNGDLDFKSAFRHSAVPHFRDLARRIGAERMQHYVNLLEYGNKDISGGLDQFWLSGGLRISPREQLSLLVKLREGTLPLSKHSMVNVRNMMLSEEQDGYKIFAKSGWAVLNETDNVGWWVGWVEHQRGVHYFATALEAKSPGEDFGPARIDITKQVLGHLNIIGSSAKAGSN